MKNINKKIILIIIINDDIVGKYCGGDRRERRSGRPYRYH